MSDEVNQLKNALMTVGSHLQDVTSELRANSADIKRLNRRSTLTEASNASLAGSFASIDAILTRLLGGQAELKEQLAQLTKRVDSLERKAS